MKKTKKLLSIVLSLALLVIPFMSYAAPALEDLLPSDAESLITSPIQSTNDHTAVVGVWYYEGTLYIRLKNNQNNDKNLTNFKLGSLSPSSVENFRDNGCDDYLLVFEVGEQGGTARLSWDCSNGGGFSGQGSASIPVPTAPEPEPTPTPTPEPTPTPTPEPTPTPTPEPVVKLELFKVVIRIDDKEVKVGDNIVFSFIVEEPDELSDEILSFIEANISYAVDSAYADATGKAIAPGTCPITSGELQALVEAKLEELLSEEYENFEAVVIPGTLTVLDVEQPPVTNEPQETPVVTPKPDKKAPKTGDFGLISTFLTSSLAIGYLVLKKKELVK